MYSTLLVICSSSLLLAIYCCKLSTDQNFFCWSTQLILLIINAAHSQVNVRFLSLITNLCSLSILLVNFCCSFSSLLICYSTNQQGINIIIEHQGMYMSSRFQCYQEGLEHYSVQGTIIWSNTIHVITLQTSVHCTLHNDVHHYANA